MPDPQPRAIEAELPPIIAPGYTYGSVTDKISAIVLTRRPPMLWVAGLAFSFALVMLLLYAIAYLLTAGVGIWGWGTNDKYQWGADDLPRVATPLTRR